MSQCKGFHAHALSNVTASHQIPIRSDSAIPRGNHSLRSATVSLSQTVTRVAAVVNCAHEAVNERYGDVAIVRR